MVIVFIFVHMMNNGLMQVFILTVSFSNSTVSSQRSLSLIMVMELQVGVYHWMAMPIHKGPRWWWLQTREV
jgi:hypothetical protein